MPACPNGCHPRFLSYSTWRGTAVRIVYAVARDGKWWYSGVLRCNDCGDPEVYFTDLDDKQKNAVDASIQLGLDQMTEMKDQYDRETLERYSAFDAYYQERANRAEQESLEQADNRPAGDARH